MSVQVVVAGLVGSVVGSIATLAWIVSWARRARRQPAWRP